MRTWDGLSLALASPGTKMQLEEFAETQECVTACWWDADGAGLLGAQSPGPRASRTLCGHPHKDGDGPGPLRVSRLGEQ